MTSQHILVGVLLASALGCSRYEYVRDTCSPPASPAATSAIAWATTPDASRTVDIQVLDVLTNEPLRGASARLRRDGAATLLDVPEVDGRYRVQGLMVGTYDLEVRRIGYRRATARVAVFADSSVRAIAPLAVDRTQLDGCGYVMVAVQKPWWKVW